MSIRRIPLATYRLQLNQSFTFSQAREIVPYLHALGISDCYFSPIMKAMPGSDHGYDVIDPAVLNPELGTEEEFFQLAEIVQGREMGILLDVVPNHMGIGKTLNRWWRDVLENGPSSRYATAFDIDWHPIKRELQNKVLLPILGDQYGTVLEDQEICVVFHDGEFGVRYADHELPLTPKSWGRILARGLETLIREIGESEPSIMELQSIMTALKNLPGSDEQDEERIAERYREVEVIKKRLATVVTTYPAIRDHLEANVIALNGVKDQPATFDELDAMLDEQAYRLASWKVASEEVNYRRFFDINDLAAIRMENPAVFQESHDLLFRLMGHPVVTGLRIDHVDGLYDPGDYLRQLHERVGPLFVIVEKILGKDEPLPGSWPVQGTTGYDFINLVNGLFVQRNNERAFSDLYEKILGRKSSYADTVYASKQLIMRIAMASQINVLGYRLDVLSERDRRSRDFTLNSLRNAIREIIACFPVYRTYLAPGRPVSA
ncbi:MAG TPA: malto-oligosyltrehalose synthase, partial [Nitrospiraceae bacterium]